MVFNSYIFIMLFLPIVVIGYFLLNKINLFLGKIFIILASLIFYLYGGVNSFIIFGVSLLVNYLFSVLIKKNENKLFIKKIFLTILIIFNVGLLLYFKYYNFFIDNINNVFLKHLPLKEIILPLGISFWTFQQIIYVVNVYKNEVKNDFIDYMVYITYFPKFVMGPINEPKDFISQINNVELKRVDFDNIANGIKIFSFGLFKKLLFADTFAKAVAWGYANMNVATSLDCFLIMIFYTFEIYFDFSGYSDMATGVSLMLNITLPINFDSPYKALSVRDFWKRWHISLTKFFTKYVYIPLGGSKKGVVRTCINVMIIFLISGMWHGANWTFIIWGAVHGTFSVIERFIDKYQKKMFVVVNWFITFMIVSVLWLMFRSNDINEWFVIVKTIVKCSNTSISQGLINAFILPETGVLLTILHLNVVNNAIRGFSLIVFTIVGFIICLVPENNYRSIKVNNVFYLVLSIIVFLWAFMCLSSESVFVYFGF